MKIASNSISLSAMVFLDGSDMEIIANCLKLVYTDKFDGERGRELLKKMDELLKTSFAESDALKVVEEEVDEDA